MHILIIEDDLDLGQALIKALQANGLSCEWLRRGRDAPFSIRAAGYDGMLLDLSLPAGGGLDGGADDYVVKPLKLAR